MSSRPAPAHGARSIFQPPRSPASTTTTTSSRSTTNDYFSSKSRKRQRPDSSHGEGSVRLDTPRAARGQGQEREALTPGWVQCPTPSDAMYGSAVHSTALVNERYMLKGGFDTPGLMASGAEDRYDSGGDFDFRRRVRDLDFAERVPAGQAMVSGPLARERNGVARMPSSPNGDPNQTGWASFAFDLVGKVFNFGSTVIKGFYSGGGKGYDLHGQPLSDSWIQRDRTGQTPVPGSWRDDEFLGDFEQDNPSSPSTSNERPSNKRRHTDKDSWVMVGTPDITESSPKRKPSSTSIPRSNLAVRPSASRAQSRRSIAPVSRRTSSYTGSPALQPPFQESNHTRRASVAPTRSPNNNNGAPRPSLHARSSTGIRPSLGSRPNSAADLSPEAEKYIKRQARQDKATDKSIGNMNKQLKDLIAQAQQALGTKYEVDGGGGGGGDYDMDEGFVDEEW